MTRPQRAAGTIVVGWVLLVISVAAGVLAGLWLVEYWILGRG